MQKQNGEIQQVVCFCIWEKKHDMYIDHKPCHGPDDLFAGVLPGEYKPNQKVERCPGGKGNPCLRESGNPAMQK